MQLGRKSRVLQTGRIRGRSSVALQTSLAIACAAAVVLVSPAPAAAVATSAAPGLFASFERRSSKIDIFTKWNTVLRRYKRERRVETRRCKRNGGSWCTLKRWRAFLLTIETKSPLAQLRAVNAYMNRVEYVTDRRNYGKVDEWATPRQFFARGGDCEDYAIAKYLSLRALGWSRDKMRLAVVIDRRKRQAHAVLIVYHNGVRYVLDNQQKRVLRDRSIRHYHPVYSINERFWWFHMAQQPAAR